MCFVSGTHAAIMLVVVKIMFGVVEGILIQRAALLLLMLNFLGFVGAVHPSKWQMFHCTADKCLVDSTKALVCQEASRLLQEIPSMTCSCSYHIYLADPIEFLFTHDARAVCKT